MIYGNLWDTAKKNVYIVSMWCMSVDRDPHDQQLILRKIKFPCKREKRRVIKARAN